MPSSLMNLLPLVLMVVIFYFLLIRPQQKRAKATASMQSSLKKGDQVVTIGGFHGIIDAVNEEQGTFTLKSTDGSKLVFEKNAIRESKTKHEAEIK